MGARVQGFSGMWARAHGFSEIEKRVFGFRKMKIASMALFSLQSTTLHPNFFLAHSRCKFFSCTYPCCAIIFLRT